MKVSPPRYYNRRALVVPPIPIEKESTRSLSKDKYQSYKCRTDPTNREMDSVFEASETGI